MSNTLPEIEKIDDHLNPVVSEMRDQSLWQNLMSLRAGFIDNGGAVSNSGNQQERERE